MKPTHLSTSTVARALACLLTALLVSAASVSALAAPSVNPTVEAPVSGRGSLDLVVYQRDLALVRDSRTAEVLKGRFELRFPEIPDRLIPGSVRIEAGEGLKVLEQRHDPGALSVHSLLERYIGREVTFERLDKRTRTIESRTGTLLSLEGGRIVRFGDRIEIDPEGALVLPGVPEGLSARPSLVWLAEGVKPEARLVEACYLTRGVDWSCDYVLSMPEEDGPAALNGWVSIDNRSGVEFPDCRLILVAGEVNVVSRVEPPQPARGVMLSASREFDAKESADFSRQEFSEYYRYDLDRTITVGPVGSSRIELLNAPRLEVTRKYRLRGDQRYFYGPAGDPQKGLRPEQVLEWTNGGQGRPVMPLPAGIVRVYSRSGKQEMFVGEDRIGHTPRDEKVSLVAGYVFDIAAERRQTDFRRISDRLREIGMEVRLRNHKSRAVEVEVLENLPGDWKVTASSHPYDKADAATIRFNPRVPANGEITLTYTVQFL